MTPSFIEKIALGLSGVTALFIGAFITFAPHAFYASYGITLGDDASLLSELRAPGAGLAVSGMVMLFGIRNLTMLPVSIGMALTVFIAFPAGRLIGLGVDGMPSASVVGALGVELGIAALSLAAFRPRLWQPTRVPPAAQPAR